MGDSRGGELEKPPEPMPEPAPKAAAAAPAAHEGTPAHGRSGLLPPEAPRSDANPSSA